MQDAFSRLRDAFATACREHDIHATLERDASGPRVVFAGQEDATPEQLGGAFTDELAKAGAPAPITLDADATEGEIERLERALRTAVARMRVLLIEHNSYLSGGLRWPFPEGAPFLRERGLAIYRFPKRGPVDVVSEDDHVRITVHAGDLGDEVSSGFYVPTLVRGDFRATVRYRLTTWEPGLRSACFALFAQDHASQLRYYAQRRSAADTPHDLFANFNNVVLTDPVATGARRDGTFVVERENDLVRCAHLVDGDETVLGEHRGDPVRDMILGAKIWSGGVSGEMEALLFDLTLTGEIPVDDQLPPPDVRPDPRAQR
jgi:hypothetical protein